MQKSEIVIQTKLVSYHGVKKTSQRHSREGGNPVFLSELDLRFRGGDTYYEFIRDYLNYERCPYALQVALSKKS